MDELFRTEALERLIAALRKTLAVAQPFTSAWEFDAFDGAVDGESLHAELLQALTEVEADYPEDHAGPPVYGEPGSAAEMNVGIRADLAKLRGSLASSDIVTSADMERYGVIASWPPSAEGKAPPK